MPKITLQQMIRQWAGAAHKFEVNVTNAEAQLARFAWETFRKSFTLKKFNSKGAPAWRSLQNPPKPTHVGLLHETGALKDSLEYRFTRQSKGGRLKFGLMKRNSCEKTATRDNVLLPYIIMVV